MDENQGLKVLLPILEVEPSLVSYLRALSLSTTSDLQGLLVSLIEEKEYFLKHRVTLDQMIATTLKRSGELENKVNVLQDDLS